MRRNWHLYTEGEMLTTKIKVPVWLLIFIAVCSISGTWALAKEDPEVCKTNLAVAQVYINDLNRSRNHVELSLARAQIMIKDLQEQLQKKSEGE